MSVSDFFLKAFIVHFLTATFVHFITAVDTDGKMRSTDVANTKQLLRLIQSIPYVSGKQVAYDYAALFFPFEKPDFSISKDEVRWDVGGDRVMLALAATFSNSPMAMNMSFQREYAEPFDWLATQFKDWAFSFVSSYLYYEDYDKNDEMTRDLYRQGIAAFGGIAPTYHIALLDKPTIVWDFYSLLLGTQIMFSFMLTNEVRFAGAYSDGWKG